MACKFLKNVDRIQDDYAEKNMLPSNIEEKIEKHCFVIACLLGLFIEHELDKCDCKKHLKEDNICPECGGADIHSINYSFDKAVG